MFNKTPAELKEQFLNIKSLPDLANLLDTKRFHLTFFYKDRKNQFYKHFRIPKKTTGFRDIYAPQNELKILLSKINYILQSVYPPNSAVHGFSKSHSSSTKRDIRSNAAKHVKKHMVLNIDLQNFFTQITYRRIVGLFRANPFRFPKEIASILAEICTYKGALPQGSPTSPVLSNMICMRLDSQLKQLAKKYRCVYTRYADDITFSTDLCSFPQELAYPKNKQTFIGKELKGIIENNGFNINPLKIRLETPNQRQEATGITINKRLNVKRIFIKQLRAILHDWALNGEQAAANHFFTKNSRISTSRNFRRIIEGRIEFLGYIRGKEDFIYAKFKNQFNKCAGRNQEHIPETKYEWISQRLWRLESTSHQGSAFVCEGNKIITCAHCIENDDEKTLELISNSKKIRFLVNDIKIQAGQVKNGLDVAVLNIIPPNHQTFNYFEIGNPKNVHQGDKVIIAGYGHTGNSEQTKIIDTKITNIKCVTIDYFDDKGLLKSTQIKHFVVADPIVSGDSGGVLLDAKYKAIGILLRGTSPENPSTSSPFEAISIDALNLLF